MAAQNPDAPRGLYATEGACDGTTHRLKLRGWQWIDASSGDQLVDLDCVMNASGLRLAGKVPFPGCNRFELERNTPLVS